MQPSKTCQEKIEKEKRKYNIERKTTTAWNSSS
jgi:hypothetical protein